MSYVAEVLSDSPVYLYACDEPSGTLANVADPSGADATLIGSPLQDQEGPLGRKAIDVNSAGYISTSSAYTLTGDQSFECWAWLDAEYDTASVGGRLAGTGTAALFGLGAWTSSLTDEVVTVAVGNTRTGFTGFTLSQGWHHLVLTNDGTQNGWTFYDNGAATGTKISSSGGMSPFANAGIQWGAVAGVSSKPFRLSMIAAYDSELTAVRVAAHYDAMLRSGIAY